MMTASPISPKVRMQRHQAAREAVEALYAAFVAGDAQEFASYFASDARLTVVATPALLPGGGMRLGREDIARHVDMVADRAIFHSHVIEEVVIDGDNIAVIWSAETQVRENGRTQQLQRLDHMRIKGGLIVELTQFVDSGAMSIGLGLIRIA